MAWPTNIHFVHLLFLQLLIAPSSLPACTAQTTSLHHHYPKTKTKHHTQPFMITAKRKGIMYHHFFGGGGDYWLLTWSWLSPLQLGKGIIRDVQRFIDYNYWWNAFSYRQDQDQTKNDDGLLRLGVPRIPITHTEILRTTRQGPFWPTQKRKMIKAFDCYTTCIRVCRVKLDQNTTEISDLWTKAIN